MGNINETTKFTPLSLVGKDGWVVKDEHGNRVYEAQDNGGNISYKCDAPIGDDILEEVVPHNLVEKWTIARSHDAPMVPLCPHHFPFIAYGQKFTEINVGKWRTWRMVGVMPSSSSYIILSDGEPCKSVYGSQKPEKSHHQIPGWFWGYNSHQVGQMAVKYHRRQIEFLFEHMIKSEEE